jgi:hypothetical protein
MKKLSFEKMEGIEGGDCFVEAVSMFAAWDIYNGDPSTENYWGFMIANATLIACVNNIP